MTDSSPPPDQPATKGFGHSPRRIAAELGILVGGGALLIGALLWFARGLSGWAAGWLPHGFDTTIGRSAWETTTPAAKRCTDAATLAYVEELTEPLLRANESPFEFQFTVADDPSVNAFALPGGFVTINLGLLRRADTGEEIAAVLAHELAHVDRRHGTQRVLRQLGTVALISLVFGGGDLHAPAELAGGLASSAYDREQEAEADAVGLETLRRAGIDPSGMARFFERVSGEPGAMVPAFLSTHPDPGDRAELAASAAATASPTLKLPAPTDIECH